MDRETIRLCYSAGIFARAFDRHLTGEYFGRQVRYHADRLNDTLLIQLKTEALRRGVPQDVLIRAQQVLDDTLPEVLKMMAVVHPVTGKRL